MPCEIGQNRLFKPLCLIVYVYQERLVISHMPDIFVVRETIYMENEELGYIHTETAELLNINVHFALCL